MDQAVKEQWLRDLRSGEYPQTQGFLKNDGGYCCLGVLCAQAVKAGIIDEYPSEFGYTWFDDAFQTPSQTVVEWAGLPDDNPTVIADPLGEGEIEVSLAQLNDGQYGSARFVPWTHAQIADVIEQQL